MSDNTRIFVYGTLKRGLTNHHYLTGQRFLGKATTTPHFRLVDCGSYPGLLDARESGRSINGEVWEVTSTCLQQLDILEGLEEGLYERRPISLQSPFDQDSILTYYYTFPSKCLPDAGEDWVEN